MKNRILYSCSWIIEFIKLVGETDKMRGRAFRFLNERTFEPEQAKWLAL